jgi:DNA topoisomerase-1
MKTLLIVESPAKSKTIEKLLGKDYIVLSSFGHIRNLESKNLGIDIENGFKPIYKIMQTRSKEIKKIKETIKSVNRVFLASDEDREGEAIAWHCAVVFKLNIQENNRICFHEITKSALENAVANPRKIDMNMVNSQQARRILDRLVGFKLSPLLWKYISPKLSAGRVQSAALKIIYEQEKDIIKFTENKNYKVQGTFEKNINGNLNSSFDCEENGIKFLNDLKSATFKIINIIKKKNEIRPPPPYITSTIQQDAGTRFGLGSKKIMSVLQGLYEGGFITYHRTDSTLLSTHIQEEIKKYLLDKFGKNYVHSRVYKSKIKCSQEAHEAIRPTHINVEQLNDSFDEIDKKIYNLIWKRTVASQMSACIMDVYTINIGISNRNEIFISKAQKILFDGYRKIYEEIKNTDNNEEEDQNSNFIVDDLKENEELKYFKIICTEKYQNPPPRFTEASLIKKMEKIGIGRPSTYSNTIEILIDRKYVEKKDIKGTKRNISINTLEKNVIKNKVETLLFGAEKKKLVPSDLGMTTINFLDSHFNNILNVNFTSDLEEKLDSIVNNDAVWNDVVKDFYNEFEPNCVKLNDKEMISKNNSDKKRLLGVNEDGKAVYAYIAKYGPVIQIGDVKKDMKYIKLESNYSVHTVTLNDLDEILKQKYPKILGQYKDIDVYLKKGMYGFYLSYNDNNIKISSEFMDTVNDAVNDAVNDDDNFCNITLENAITCIENSNNGNNSIIKKIGDYTIKNGKYGPYIEYKGKFYNIPTKNLDNNLVKDLTKEDIELIIKTPKKKYVKK